MEFTLQAFVVTGVNSARSSPPLRGIFPPRGELLSREASSPANILAGTTQTNKVLRGGKGKSRPTGCLWGGCVGYHNPQGKIPSYYPAQKSIPDHHSNPPKIQNVPPFEPPTRKIKATRRSNETLNPLEYDAQAAPKPPNSIPQIRKKLRQHRIIPALRLKHRSGGCGTASALPKCSIMSGCGTRIVLRGQKPLALCDRCPCFGSLFPPLAALTFAASSIICAFGLASAAPRSPYRHLELCGIALTIIP